jgi:hypothetical protein
VRTNWQKISLIVRRALEGVTLADMVQPEPVERPVVLHRMRGAATQPTPTQPTRSAP